MSTVNDVLTLTEARSPIFKKSGTTSVNLAWANRLQEELYEAIYKKIPENYITDFTITLVSGTTEYDLPTDFGNINMQRQRGNRSGRRAVFSKNYYNDYRNMRYSDGVLCGFFELDSDGEVVMSME